MDTAFAWIGYLVEWFARFIPRQVILNTTEGAVKFKRGHTPVYCGPGIHWYWPWRSQWQAFPMVRQPLDLRTQTITTVDGRTIAVGGLIVYEIIDLLKLVPTTYQPDQAVAEMTLPAIHSVCSRLTWEQLQRENRRGTLDTKLRRMAQKVLSSYGVRVIQVQLTDLTPCRAIRLISTVSNDGA